jgi:alpha-glucosidase
MTRNIAAIIGIQIALLSWSVTGMTQDNHHALSHPFTIRLANGQFMQVQVCNASIIRVRVRKDSIFKESLLEKYGILQKDWKGISFTRNNTAGRVSITTEQADLNINTISGNLTLKNASGKVLVQQVQTSLEGNDHALHLLKESLTDYFGSRNTSRNIIGDPAKDTIHPVVDTTYEADIRKQANFVSLALNDDERLYGLGSASRRHIQHRGEAVRIWVKYQQSEGF